MRARALVPFALVLAAGTARAQHVTSAPPPLRTFGPDSTATGVFTGAGLTPPGLTCDAPPAPAALTCTGYLASAVDGTLLETTVRLPQDGRTKPIVVAMHGWGGSQGSMARYDGPLSAAGYAVVRYSARGFGGSWGQANLADEDVEGADLRSVVGQVADLYPDAVNCGSVAVFGASYGGAHAWLGALTPAFTSPAGRAVSVRTVIPVATWSDLLNGLVPNGRPDVAQSPTGAQKLSFVEALFVGGLRARADRPYPSYPPYLLAWDAQMLASELPYDATPTGRALVDALQGYRSIYWQQAFWERVRANRAAGAPQLPVLAVQGWTDDLFPPIEALRMYDALRAIDPAYPIALYLGDLGHPRAANKPGELGYALDLVMPWLGWFLKGEGTRPAFDVHAAITRPAAAPFDPADVVTASDYVSLATTTATHVFGGWRVITFDPLNVSGFQWDPLVLTGCGQLFPCPPAPPSDVIPGDVAVYEVPASQLAGGSSFLVAGEPAVTFFAATIAPRVQLDVRLLDVAPNGTRALVTRGTLTLDAGATPLGMRRVQIATAGNLWPVAADHRLRLEVTNVDSPYLRPSLVPSATAIANVELSLPIRR